MSWFHIFTFQSNLINLLYEFSITTDRMHFYRKLDAFESLMDSGKLKEEDRLAYECYYDIEETPARGLFSRGNLGGRKGLRYRRPNFQRR